MELKLKRLTLLNFKGVRSLSIDFSDVTNIDGDNGTGKTTIADAYFWLLFGKDSCDKKDFNIKTLDKNNKVIERLDHEVEGEFLLDGNTVTLKKVFREKWVKKRGYETTEFTGHETECYYNGVPMQMKEYTTKIDTLINEQLSKLLTNPNYFNSLKWQERREILTKMVGDISDNDIFNLDEKFQELVAELNKGKTMKEFRSQVAAQRKKINDDLSAIPTRINEANRALPEELPNYEVEEKNISNYEKEITEIEDNISDAYKRNETEIQQYNNELNKLNTLKNELQSLEREKENLAENSKRQLVNDIRFKEQEVKSTENDVNYLKSQISNNESRLTQLTDIKSKLLDKYNSENSKIFVIAEIEDTCPTCKQHLPIDQIDEKKASMEQNFNENKVKILNDVKSQGLKNKADIENLQTVITGYKNDLSSKENALIRLRDELTKLQDNLKSLVVPSDESLEQKIATKQAEIDNFVQPEKKSIDVSELRIKKTELQQLIDKCREKLAVKNIVENTNKRIAELEEQEKKLASELTYYERMEFLMNDFDKRKIETIEHRVNSMFTFVQFKMFENQINGGEVQICECIVDGVPYYDINTAKKINAGIDIINTLANYYGVYAPIFIDNRESVNNLLPCKSQIVNLIVSKEPKLRITN